MDDGWSIKALHRRIMLSATYQQASDDRPEARAVDPENALYWRMNRRRLDFEATRDALLAVSGRLDGRIGGPPMPGLTGPGARPPDPLRLHRPPQPARACTAPSTSPTPTRPARRRDQTTVAPQALFLMNHPFAIDSARAILARPEVAGSATTRRQGRRGSTGCSTAARPTPTRSRWPASSSPIAPAGPDPWPALAQALLMANEFVFVD